MALQPLNNLASVFIYTTTITERQAYLFQDELKIRSIDAPVRIYNSLSEISQQLNTINKENSIVIVLTSSKHSSKQRRMIRNAEKRDFKPAYFYKVSVGDISDKIDTDSYGVRADRHVAQISDFVFKNSPNSDLYSEEKYQGYARSNDFGKLLTYFLINRINPDNVSWEKARITSVEDLASSMGVSRHIVMRWLNNEEIPEDISNIKDYLFGDSQTHNERRKDLEAAFTANKISRQPLSGNTAPSIEFLPVQQRLGLLFGGTEHAPIDLSETQSPHEVKDILERTEEYEEIKFKARELRSLGSNRLGRLNESLDRFIKLPEDLSNVKAKILWSRANTLRICLDDHKLAANQSSPDERALEPVAASQLLDLVETINIFFLGNPILIELDAVKAGPKETQDQIGTTDIVRPFLIEASNSRAATTEDAGNELLNATMKLEMNNNLQNSQQGSEFSFKTVRNFIAEFLRRAYRIATLPARGLMSEAGIATKGVREGFYRGIGAGGVGLVASEIAGTTSIFTTIADLIHKHAVSITAYAQSVFQESGALELIRWIITTL